MIPEETNISKTIMVLGKHLYTVEHVIKLLEPHGHTCIYMLEIDEELDRRLLEKEFDMLLIIGSVEPHLQDNIIQKVQMQKEHVKILIHRGGPATILAEVKAVLEG